MPWASYQIHKIAGCACAWNAGNVSPHPGMHHSTCVTHVGIANPQWREHVPGIPGACATGNFTYLTRDPWFISCTRAYGRESRESSQSNPLLPPLLRLRVHHVRYLDSKRSLNYQSKKLTRNTVPLRIKK